MQAIDWLRTLLELGRKGGRDFLVKPEEPFTFHVGQYDVWGISVLLDLYDRMPDETTIRDLSRVLDAARWWHTFVCQRVAAEEEVAGKVWRDMEGNVWRGGE